MNTKDLIKRAEKAQQRKRPWLSIWEDCIDFAQPMRDSFMNTDSSGSERMDKIYDETPVLANQEFVSLMQDGMMPSDSKFFDFAFVIPNADRRLQSQLSEVSDYVYYTMRNGGIDNVASEVFYDIAIGTGSISVSESMDTANSSVKFETVPLQEYSIDQGPFGGPDGRFRRHSMTLDEAKVRWQDAKISKEMMEKASNNPDLKFKFIECVYRDWTQMEEVWLYKVISLEDKSCIIEREDKGSGAEPIATGRWSKAGREFYGRGPLINALPAIRSLNLTYELLFEAGEMNIGGIWQYESNGIVNTDNINLVPGTLIPVEPGTKGLSAIQNPGRFDLSQIILRDQQEKVKRALYNQDFGPTTQTPRSATEIAERSASLNRLIGASRHRIQTELINKIVMRTVYLLKKQGKIDLPAVDGKELRIVPVSPMARFSKRGEIQAMQEFQGQLQMMFGPQVAMMVNKVPETVHKLAKYNDYPIELINSEDEIKQTLNNIMQAAQQQQAMGADVEGMIQ